MQERCAWIYYSLLVYYTGWKAYHIKADGVVSRKEGESESEINYIFNATDETDPDLKKKKNQKLARWCNFVLAIYMQLQFVDM